MNTRKIDRDEQRKELKDYLKTCGWKEISFSYSGYGDSGNIENISFDNTPYGHRYDNVNNKFFGDLENFFYELMYDNFPGWELDEGSQGDMVWDLVVDKISGQHNQNVLTFDSTDYEDLR